MGNVNKVFLMGNLTRDPELRYTPNGTPVCEFGLATNRTYTTKDGQQRQDTCFVTVSVWGRRGVVVSEYFSKGSPIFVEGRLSYDTWETADGRRSRLTVVAEDFQFVAPATSEAAASAGGGTPTRRSQPRDAEGEPSEQEVAPDEPESLDVSDDEIPF